MKKYCKMFISCLLTFTMVFTSIQWSSIVNGSRAVKAATEKTEDQEEQKEVVKEESTKDSTTFQMSDGKKQTVFYGQEVRFENEDGKLQDYDPSLVQVKEQKSDQGEDLSDYQYENKEGDKKHYLPKNLSEETPVLMENGDYQISFAPIYGQDAKKEEEAKTDDQVTDTVEDAVSQANEAVRSITNDGTSSEEKTEASDDTEDALTSVKQLERRELEDASVEDAEENVDEKQVKVSYESQKKECTFSYQSLNMGIKESIVLTKAPEGNVLRFRFKAKGLIPKKNTMDGGISFLDEKTEEIVATLEAPSMNDKTENAYSEKLSYDIEEDGEEGSYLLTLHLDEDYFKDKDREYPVTIDPTVTWTGSTDFWDVYVINGSYKDTNFYDSGVTVMMAGKAKQGVYRTYLRFKDFTKKIDGKYVDSATLTMYETANSQSGQTIEARRVTENWSRPGLTWSNRPGYSTNYGSVKTTGTAKKERTINLTQYARECASGKITSYGIMLKNSDETSSYGQFFSSRASANRPKMSVTYYDGPTTATSTSVTPVYAGKNNSSIKVSWEGINSKSLNRIEYRIATMLNGTEDNSDYVEYSDATKIGTTSSGSANVNISGSKWPDGDYKIVVRGVDNGYIKGYGKGAKFTIDRTSPKITSKSLDSGSSSSDPSSSTTPKLTVKMNDKNPSYFKYKVEGDSSYVKSGTVDSNGSATADVKIPADATTGRKEFKISVIAVDKAGNESDAQNITYYYTDASKAQDYTPANVKVRKSYGKTVISWDKKDLPDSIYYAVYRGESADFTADDTTLVRGAIKDSYCMDTKTGDGKDYYYKVCAQKLSSGGNVNGQSDITTSEKITQDAKKEYEKRLGSKDYRDTMEISTPNGTGDVEKSEGNLTYGSTDFSIPSLLLDLGLTRTYNSQSDKTGMLGLGWYDSFHKELYQVGDQIIFQDSDGTYLTYQKSAERSSNVEYKNEETKDYQIAFEQKESAQKSQDSDQKAIAYVSNIKFSSENVFGTASSSIKKYTPGEKAISVSKAVQITTKDGIEYDFDTNGQITKATDSNNNYVIYQYDDKGRMYKLVSNLNKELVFTYYESGEKENLVKEIELLDGTKMSYSYDGTKLIGGSHKNSSGSSSVDQTYAYGSNGKMSKILDAKKNQYQITYTGEKAGKFIQPNGEYRLLSYGDGTTMVSVHKSDGTKTAQDSVTFDKDTGKILKKTDANGIESSYSYEDGVEDGQPDDWENEYLVTKIKTEINYQELDANGLVKFLKSEKEEEKTFAVASITYNQNDYVTEEIEENGDVTKTKYENKEHPYLPSSEMIENENKYISKTDYIYDKNGNTTCETEWNEKGEEETKTITSYDEHGQPLKTTMTQEGNPNLLEETTYQDSKQGTTQTTVITQGEVKELSVTKTDAMGREIETINKDANGNILNSIVTIYDFMGRVLQTKTTSAGITQTDSITYDANGNVQTETNVSGVTISYDYDSLNRVIKATESADGINSVTETSYGYENAQVHTLNGIKSYQNLSVQTTKTNGRISEKTWTNATGQTVRSFKDGLYTDHVFTSDGKEIATISLGTKTSGDEKISLQLYDKKGQQTATIQNPEITKGTSDAIVKVGSSSIIQKTEYDIKGNEISQTDGNGNQISYSYDDQNRVTEITKGGQKTKVSYQVNSDGSITTSVTDANGHVNKEVASADGSVTTTTDFGDSNESITTKYAYDDRGNKLSETYANGAKKTYEYNSRNLLVKTQSYDKDGTKTLSSKYRYDDQEQLLEMIDYRISSGTETAYRYTEYSYDKRGRITVLAEISQEIQPTIDDIKEHQILYTYDRDGNLSKVSYPTTKDGVHALSYIYDQNGWLSEIKANVYSKGQTVEKSVRSYSYDDQGKVKEIKDHRNLLNSSDQAIKKVYIYDSFDRVKEMTYTDLVTGKVMESYQYSYDKNSNITKKTEVNNYPKEDSKKVNETKVYTYDTFGRLVKTVTTDHKKNDQIKTITYTYDNVGNRIKEDDGTTKTAYTYNGLDQLKSSTKEKGTTVEEVRQYSYDANGNQTDVKNTKTGKTESYIYDAENRLSKVSVTDNKDGKTVVIQENRYNGDGQRIQKVEGSETTNYYYQDGVVSYTTDRTDDQNSQNLIGTDGNILATQRYGSDDTDYLLYNKDIQGSSSSLVKEDGSADATYRYTDFGETTINGDNKAGNEVCYTGEIYDQSTGLYYLNARYYDSEDGQFMTEDTYRGEVDDPDTQNLYGYCAENPVNYVDPSGHGREVSMSQVVKALRICTDGTIKNKYEKNYCIHKKGKKDGPYNDKNHQCKTTAFPTNSSKKNKMSKIASDEIPYIVVPPGDKPYIYGIGVIENINTGDYLYCIIADVGPKMLGKKKNGLGEVSIYAAWKMKKNGIPSYNKKVSGNYRIGQSSYEGNWRIYAYKKAAPKPKATFCGWNTNPKKLKQQIKKIGKKVHTSVLQSKKRHCLN